MNADERSFGWDNQIIHIYAVPSILLHYVKSRSSGIHEGQATKKKRSRKTDQKATISEEKRHRIIFMVIIRNFI